ncbi:MAG: hypothetical protein OEY64_11550 [Nitrospinota bacterium]|nr:hypothetical protein [Nitrospinota bacterium]
MILKNKISKGLLSSSSAFAKRTVFSLLSFSLLVLNPGAASAGLVDTDLVSLKHDHMAAGYVAFVKDIGFGMYFNPGNSGSQLAGRHLPVGMKLTGELGILSPSSKGDDLLNRAGGGNLSSTLYPKIKLQVGLPGGVDFGVNYVTVSDFISSSGVEARYNIDQFLYPKWLDLTVRAHYSIGTVTSELNIYSSGIDVSAGLDTRFLKPYVNIGGLFIMGSPAKSIRDINPDVVKRENYAMVVGAVGTKIAIRRSFCAFGEFGMAGDAYLTTLGFGLDF